MHGLKPRRAFTLFLALVFVVAASACAKPCRLSTDCERGELCNPQTATCAQGCTSDHDCVGTARCNRERGTCSPFVGVIPGDSGTGTSTATDAVTADSGTATSTAADAATAPADGG